MIDPSKMTSKIKLHLLVHLKEDIIRFGPLIGVATEVFECFNAIFRFCSVFSNHLAPSRDIAFQLASQEVLKHRLTGGWWPTEKGEWQQPGPSVRNFIHAHPNLQAWVGWTDTKPLVNGKFIIFHVYSIHDIFQLLCIGFFKLAPLKLGDNKKVEARKYSPWSQTYGSKALNCDFEDANSQWTPCQYTVARSGDKCFVGSWIFSKSPIQVCPKIINKDEHLMYNLFFLL